MSLSESFQNPSSAKTTFITLCFTTAFRSTYLFAFAVVCSAIAVPLAVADEDHCLQYNHCTSCYSTDQTCQWCSVVVETDFIGFNNFNVHLLGKCISTIDSCDSQNFGELRQLLSQTLWPLGSLRYLTRRVPRNAAECDTIEWPSEVWKHDDCESCTATEEFGWCQIAWHAIYLRMKIVNGSGGVCVRKALGNYCNPYCPLFPLSVTTSLGHVEIQADMKYKTESFQCGAEDPSFRIRQLQKQSEISTVPLQKQSEISTVPLQKQSEISTVPLQKQSEISTVPLQKQSEISTVPLQKQQSSCSASMNCGDCLREAERCVWCGGALTFGKNINSLDHRQLEGRCVDAAASPEQSCLGIKFGSLQTLLNISLSDTEGEGIVSYSVQPYTSLARPSWCGTLTWPRESSYTASCEACSDEKLAETHVGWCQVEILLSDSDDTKKYGGICLDATLYFICNRNFIHRVLGLSRLFPANVNASAVFITDEHATSCPKVSTVPLFRIAE